VIGLLTELVLYIDQFIINVNDIGSHVSDIF
jgi:hypothetical protein